MPTDASNKKPNEAHVETCGAGYSEYAMCDSPEACADLRNAPVVEPEPCRYTQPDGTRCTRPGGPRHGMCGPHYWARDDEGHAPVVEPSPVCGARVDYHGGTCGKPVGHDEPCTPVVEPGPIVDGCTHAGPCTDRCEPERMPCGHSHAAIVSSGEGTSYCGECAEACSPDDYETGPEDAEQMGAEAERARIVAIIERFESPMVLINRRDLLAKIDGGPTDA